MRQSRAQMVAQLKARGFAFSEFTLSHDGNYAPEDAEWNYKDVPHLNYVHKAIRDTPSVVEKDTHAYINIRKDFGLPELPSAVMVYQSRPNALTYYTTWFFFVVLIESVYDELGFNRTRVSTTYSVGCPKLFRWFLPALRWAITRNYHCLMQDDIPMRERRAQLRAWGYSFLRGRSDFSWEESVDITKSNLKLPESVAFQAQTISVPEDLNGSGDRFLGLDDHLGLRLVRSNGHLLVYPRLCPHEGASLDQQPCSNRRIVCPWHGRVFQPVASFDLSKAETQHAVTAYHDMTFSSGTLTVRPKGTPGSRP